jgi:hypothetical protein
MSNLCVMCKKRVGQRQQGIACDICEKWTHRACGTGYSKDEYLAAARVWNVALVATVWFFANAMAMF